MARTISRPRNYANYDVAVNLHVTECPHCGVTYAIPDRLDARAREENAAVGESLSVFCPLGHSWHYTGRNAEQELERKLQFERERSGRLAARADQAEASARGHKGAATRARRERDRIIAKVKEGVCPVKGCGRSFQNVRRHIASQHPEFDVPEGE